MKSNDVKKQSAHLDDIVYCEHNLFRWPLFFVNKRDVGSQKVIYIPITTDYGEGYWKVSPNVEYGAGGPFDDAVLTVIQKILTTLPKPIENPVDIGSLAGIARMLGYKDTSGRVLNDIKRSLKRLTSLLISSKFTYYDKLTKSFLKGKEGVFHILDRVCFVGEALEDGTISEKNLVWINSVFLKNINSWYVNPVDVEFYLGLKDTERALFKLLINSFFANRHNTNPVKFKYSTITKLTTLLRRKQLSQAQQQLDPAHESLTERGFLMRYEWNMIQECKDDWIILYSPGEVVERHISLHLKSLNKNGFSECVDKGFNLENLLSSQDTSSLSSERDNGNKSEVLKKLWDRGVLKTTAQELVLKYSSDFLLDAVSYFDIISKKKEVNSRYLIKIIEETSHEYIKSFLERHHKQVEADKKVEDSIRKRELRQKYEDAMSLRVQDYISGLSREEQEELRQKAMKSSNVLNFMTVGSASFEAALSKEIEKIVIQEKLVDLLPFELWLREFGSL